ncbi:MAG TPA: CoA-transferase subunit beta [Alphaproteobacteria bacterium]|jgi:glutaconate CoA-transferase subunit B
MSELYDPEEMMTIAAARALSDGDVCFVGIGLPSTAANLARLTKAPDVVLIYESGCIGAKPDILPLSIGDSELVETADVVVSVPEIFRYWLQGGKVDVGFLGAAQLDRYGNINTTIVGDYNAPKVRLPGAGGAPEIATNSKQVFITLKQSTRTFVDKPDFITSAGYLTGGDARARLNVPGRGPTQVFSDLGILQPDPVTKELTMTSLHPGVTPEQAIAATGWPLKIHPQATVTPAPTEIELQTLRDMKARAAQAHSRSNLRAS